MTLNRDDIANRLAAVGYIADHDVATAIWLMGFLKRPLLLEGEAGVGKTEVAKALAAVHGAELIRLQCYEGLDQNAALYGGTISVSSSLSRRERVRAQTPTSLKSIFFPNVICSSGLCWLRSVARSLRCF